MPKQAQIESSFQLLVEGNDQRNFFEALVDHLPVTNIQIQNFGGVNELGGFLRALVNAPDFSTVKNLGIVRDAETSSEAAFQSVQSALDKAALPVPSIPLELTEPSPAVAVLILPGEHRMGMLETLLCESFSETSVSRCIDDFFKCVESLPDMTITIPDKARAHAYLTTKPKPHLSVGVAAKNDYWNLDHAAFNTVRNFLQNMIAAIEER